MNEEKKLKDLFVGIVYGEVVYWTVLTASIVVIIGSVLAFVTEANFASPSYWITSIWEGKSTTEVWEESTINSLPPSHWYLSHLATGDGLAALGISLGVFSIVPALVCSAVVLLKRKSFFFGSLALIAAIIVMVAMVGLLPLPS